MRNFMAVIWVTVLVTACEKKHPQKIVDQAIEAAGGSRYLSSTIEFDFRGRHYVAKRNGGTFSYERIFTNDKDSTQRIHDFVTNDGFRREVNDSIVSLPDSMKVKYAASTNSVIYFALLPYGLNDQSVRKKYLGETVIDQQPFHKIHVSFAPVGGGEDFEDEFIYWIHQKNFTIGYLAYSFNEDGKSDVRFRKAVHPRQVNGIHFQDYINYKPKTPCTLDSLQARFINHELEELSRIELLNLNAKSM